MEIVSRHYQAYMGSEIWLAAWAMHIRYAINGAPPGIAAKASGVPIAMAPVEPLMTVAVKNSRPKIR